jgi:hypothetical protein
MAPNRGGTQRAGGRRHQVEQPRRQVVQSRDGATSNSIGEDGSDEITNGCESGGGDAGEVPSTVGGEGAGEFEKGDEHTEEGEGSSITGTSTIVTTSTSFERQNRWKLHKRNIAQQVRETIFYQMPYVQQSEKKCGFGSNFQKATCRLSSVDKMYEEALWNDVGKREARKGLSDKRKTVTSAMQKEFKSKWPLIDATEFTTVLPRTCSNMVIPWECSQGTKKIQNYKKWCTIPRSLLDQWIQETERGQPVRSCCE